VKTDTTRNKNNNNVSAAAMGVAGVDAGYLRGFGNEFESEALPAGPHTSTLPQLALRGTRKHLRVCGITNCITRL